MTTSLLDLLQTVTAEHPLDNDLRVAALHELAGEVVDAAVSHDLDRIDRFIVQIQACLATLEDTKACFAPEDWSMLLGQLDALKLIGIRALDHVNDQSVTEFLSLQSNFDALHTLLLEGETTLAVAALDPEQRKRMQEIDLVMVSGPYIRVSAAGERALKCHLLREAATKARTAA